MIKSILISSQVARVVLRQKITSVEYDDFVSNLILVSSLTNVIVCDYCRNS